MHAERFQGTLLLCLLPDDVAKISSGRKFLCAIARSVPVLGVDPWPPLGIACFGLGPTWQRAAAALGTGDDLQRILLRLTDGALFRLQSQSCLLEHGLDRATEYWLATGTEVRRVDCDGPSMGPPGRKLRLVWAKDADQMRERLDRMKQVFGQPAAAQPDTN